MGTPGTNHDLTGMPRLAPDRMRAGPLLHVPALLATMGVDPAPVLQAAGLARDALSDPERAVPLRQAVRLLIAGAARTGRPHFGLLAGQHAALRQYGLVGLRMMHAPSVGTAWRGLVLTLQLNDRANVPALAVGDREAVLSFTPYREDAEGIEHIMDFTLATACSAMRTLCGAAWAPTEVHFAHRRPRDVRPYHDCFKAPVRFGTSRTAMTFPATVLDRRVIGASAVKRRAIEQAIADALRAQDLALPDLVRRALFARMSQDDVSIDGVARLLGLHKRTLNRRLAVLGTSYAALLAEVRYQVARQLLAVTDLPFVDIAGALAYTDASTFSRSFRAWSGTTPSGWRQKHSAPRYA